MIAVKEWLINTLKADTTLQGYFVDTNGNYNIFPSGVDIAPEALPTIVVQDIADVILSAPLGQHIGTLQVDIYMANDKYSMIDVDTVYERIQVLCNLKESLTVSTAITGTLWWVKQISARDRDEAQRKLWHKQVDIKYWYRKTDGS